MSKKQLTHTEALDLVYGAIASLRSKGNKNTKITVSEVARISGVSRATINSKNKDWVEVREVIFNNKPSPRLELAGSELQERNRWRIEASKLESELDYCEEKLKEITDNADGVYRKLLEQLHKYMYLARQAPGKIDNEAKTLIELKEYKDRCELYEAEIRRLKASSEATILPFFKKEIINVYPDTYRANLEDKDLIDLTMDAVYELNDYFEKPHQPRVVYIMCGNFASGKSTWINEHKPRYQGSAVYFDGTNHSLMLRKLIIRHIRNLSRDCKIICVRLFCDLGKCLKRNNNDTRIRYKNQISEKLINTIDKHFEEVTITEGFDEIIISRCS